MNLRRLGIVAGLASLLACSEPTGITDPDPEPKPNNPTEQNRPPVFNSSPPQVCNENNLYIYEVKVSDPDFDPIKLSLTKKPSWLSLSGNLVSGRCPEVTKDEVSGVEIKADDGKNTVMQNFSLNVRNLYNSYVVSPTSTNPLTSALENSLTFANPVTFNTGDILIATINQITPYGAARKVTSTSGDRKTVNTNQATIEEIVKDGKFSLSGTVSQANIQASGFVRDGVSLVNSETQTSGFGISLTNVVLYDFDGNLATTGDQLLANGRVEFETDFKLDADIGLIKLKNLDFQNKSTVRSDITVGYNASIGIATLKEIALGEYYFAPIIVPSPFGLPIPIVPKIGFYIGLNPTKLNPLALRVKQESSLELGLKYSGSWDPTAIFDSDFEFSNSAITGDWDLSVYATPRLTLLVGGVLGTSAGISAGLELEASQSNWTLSGNLAANLGISMEIFTKGIAAYYKNVLNYKQLLAQSGSQNTDSTFIDSRDGRTYKFVKIGNQTWMAENMNYNVTGSEYYQNNTSLGNIYGRLYDWNSSKIACPSNWHLPTQAEWGTLFTTLGGTSSSTTGGKMKTTGTVENGTGRWRSPNTGATNESKFSAQPGGMKDELSSLPFSEEGYSSYFWANTTPSALAYSLHHNTSTAGSYLNAGNPEGFKFSVRCVKN
jgi:uncharacterized protein (TIGR02145 family)